MALQSKSDIQTKVTQLVQAAMSGDQQAQQQVLKIMEAAQQGDQQAAQIAQMIQQIAQQMQGGTPEMLEGGYLDRVKNSNSSQQPKLSLIEKYNRMIDTYSPKQGEMAPAMIDAQPDTTPRSLQDWYIKYLNYPNDTRDSINQYDYRNAIPDNPKIDSISKNYQPVDPRLINHTGYLVPVDNPNTTKYSKGGKTPCPCTLQRRGGKVVEVDCKGNVIKRKCGGKTKK